MRIPALSIMLTVGWAFFGFGVLAICAFVFFFLTLGDLLETLQTSGILWSVGLLTASIGLGFLLIAWILTAIKQMFHAYATGWQADY